MIAVTNFIKELMSTSFKKTNLLDKTQTTTFVKDGELETVLFYLNSALTHLFTKYLLLHKQCLIQTVLGITQYHLREQFAVSNVNSTETNKYIVDTVSDPFYKYVLDILFIYDKCGNRIKINDHNDNYSVHLSEFDTLQISGIYDFEYINVIYKANHVPIISTDIDTQYLNIPPFLEKALKYYITYDYFSDELGPKNIQKSQEAYNKYLMCENDILTNGLIPDYNTTNIKLDERGYV